jgi:hypothetical protein
VKGHYFEESGAVVYDAAAVVRFVIESLSG